VSEDELTPEAWLLLEVVRRAESPSELEMRRVRRAIAVGVGATALAMPVAKAATSVATTFSTTTSAAAITAGKGAAFLTALKGVAVLAVLTSLAAGTVWFSRHRSTEPAVGTPAARRAASTPMEAPPPSTLLGELTLLQRAQRALADGAPGVALSLAGEHASRYPRSQLSRERDAVRVFAYCALGRSADARALTTEILKSSPRSPLRASLEQSCGAPLPELASPKPASPER
jgi:hypothetical protein